MSSATNTRRFPKSFVSVRMMGSGEAVWRAQAHGAAEVGTLPGCTFDGNLSAHHADQLLGDGEAETGAAAVVRGGGIDL